MIKRRIWAAVAVTSVAFSHHGAGRMPMQGKAEPMQFFVFPELRFPKLRILFLTRFLHANRCPLCSKTRSSEKSGRRGWGTPPPFSLPTEGGEFHRKVAY